MRFILPITAALAILAGGCFGQTTKCLETPISEDVGQVATDRCSRAMGDDLENKALFEHYMAVLRAQGRYVDIISWSQRVLENDPSREDALYHLAVGLRKDGQCEAAIARYRQFALKMPDEADPYFGMGICFEEIGDRLAAVQAYGTYVKKENRAGQEAWVDKARARISTLESGGGATPARDPDEPPTEVADANPQEGEPSEPTEPEPDDAEPGAPAPVIPAPAVVPEPEAPTPAVVPESEPEPVKPESEPEPVKPEPEPEPVKPEPAKPEPVKPEAEPEPEPDSKPAPPNCNDSLAEIKKGPFDTGAYEAYAKCALARKEFKAMIPKLKIGLRDNPGFDRGWYYQGEAYSGLGDKKQASFAYSKACKKGVNEACSKF